MACDLLPIDVLEATDWSHISGDPSKDQNTVLFCEHLWAQSTKNTESTPIVTVVRYVSKSIAEFLGERECLTAHESWLNMQIFEEAQGIRNVD
jgi:hypothetical protein